MAPKKKGELLARVNFPLYSVKMLTPRYLLVAGGGGKTRSGIANAIEVYELSYNGTKCCARPACRYVIGDSACMNCATWFNGKEHIVFAGLNGDCQVYQAKYKVLREDEYDEIIRKEDTDSQSGNIRRRRTSEREEKSVDNASSSAKNDKRKQSWNKSQSNPDNNSNSVSSLVGFDFKPLQRFQTDFTGNQDTAFQKVVRVSHDGKILATGGSDGHIRIWKYPELTLSVDIKAHSDDVDDLDIHPLTTKIISASRDGHVIIWSVKNGKNAGELKWNPPNGQKYRCRNCRFGMTENDKNRSKIFTAHVPLAKDAKSSLRCFLVKWDANKLIPEKVLSVREILSSLTVSDDGRFVGTGTMSGGISIYIAFSLQRIYHVEAAHSIFITGLEFLPNSDNALQVVGNQDSSLVSISVDNQIQIHHIPKQATIHIGLFIFIMIAVLIATFTIMSYLGL
ncbi:hypothetical protein CHUAL_004765 [Chamberlinius hualienensis]